MELSKVCDRWHVCKLGMSALDAKSRTTAQNLHIGFLCKLPASSSSKRIPTLAATSQSLCLPFFATSALVGGRRRRGLLAEKSKEKNVLNCTEGVKRSGLRW